MEPSHIDTIRQIADEMYAAESDEIKAEVEDYRTKLKAGLINEEGDDNEADVIVDPNDLEAVRLAKAKEYKT